MEENKVKEMLDKLIKGVEAQKAELEKKLDEKLEGIDPAEIAATKEAMEAQQKALDEQAKSLTGVKETLEKFTRQMSGGGGNKITEYDPRYKGAFDNEKMAGDFGLWCLAKFNSDSAVRERCAKSFAERDYTMRNSNGHFVKGEDFVKAMSSSADTSGGYLAPDEFNASLIRHVNLFGTARQFLMPVPMGRERTSIPKRTGGLTVYYPDMGQAPTASDLSFALVTLTAKKWAQLVFIDEELDEDAVIGIGELVATEMALAFAIAEDTNAFLGDGTSAFAGITGVFPSANTVLVTMPPTKTAITDLILDDLVKTKYAVDKWVRSEPDCAWYCSSDIAGVLERMTDLDGRPLFQGPTEGFPLRVFGYPVREVEILPESAEIIAGSKFIAFGSLRAWGALGTRRSVQIKRSTEVKFLEGQITLMGVLRQDIQETSGEAMSVLRTALS